MMDINTWYMSTHKIPVFGDVHLSVATMVHDPKCPSGANENGVASMRWCRCQSSRRHLDPRVPLFLIAVKGSAALVHEQQGGLVWVEAQSLKKTQSPKPIETERTISRRTPPRDFIVVEAALGDGLKLPRRRRPVRGGEIVFVRSEVGPDMSPWRLLGLTFVNNQRAALLIDASLRFEMALNPGWSQQRTLILSRDGKRLEPHQLLIPAFPLPDGTADPGWAI